MPITQARKTATSRQPNNYAIMNTNSYDDRTKVKTPEQRKSAFFSPEKMLVNLRLCCNIRKSRQPSTIQIPIVSRRVTPSDSLRAKISTFFIFTLHCRQRYYTQNPNSVMTVSSQSNYYRRSLVLLVGYLFLKGS